LKYGHDLFALWGSIKSANQDSAMDAAYETTAFRLVLDKSWYGR